MPESAKPANAGVDVDEQPSTVFYEIFVRSFYDSNGDGIGDLGGVIEKLDYLNDGDPDTDTDLGVGGIWLMPINPSPSYHGYDVTDYYDINPEYGTLEDFKRLTEEARKRGIKVIMDLVVNHSSSEHPWFTDSKNPDGKYRSWYTWKNKDEKVETASATGSGNAWHSYGDSKYLGTFWEGMPDLNLDNPEVRQEMIKIGQFWLKQGADGFRLDAAKHIFIDTQADYSNEDKAAKNITWWNEFRKGMDEVNPEAYIVGEIWENSPVTVAPYLEPFDSGFNFGLAQQLVDLANRERGADLGFSIARAYGLFAKASNGAFIDAPFLSNHDQNRVMSVLGGNVDRAKVAASLLLTIPGNPFIYYGEEIGMQGMKPDEFIREPMLWYEEPKAGQTTWENTRNNSETLSVERQSGDPESLLSHYRKLIGWRNEVKALRDGSIADYPSDNDKMTAFVRMTQDERVLVVHNMSGEEQKLTLRDQNEFTNLLLFTKEGSALGEDGKSLTLPPYSSAILKE
ncbi:MAG TPA: alpha-amylase family glycosyl hydrolase [Paenibacillus sp.]|uniref:alpha-amylase family glycosyl hydrolase n=1 Tax=Paenibacillus sp. TaxID=58172 RepID=UPI0028D62855|nr:alpha-amylase family glycosyl hydrolase [Paenibacillus sp.]HUC93308.1 alpha-amylase family glycosyl hydrolase [Paenibacillus sp.]